MKRSSCIVPLLLLVFLLGSAPFAKAQGISAYFGLGTAQAPGSGQTIDTFGDGNFLPTPAMGGIFAVLGGDFMIKPSIGVGAEYTTRFAQAPYAGLNYRPSFYDFNAIWHPLPKLDRIVPEIQGGIGGANLQFYLSQQACDQFAGCSSASQYVESSNHFQVHAGVGVRFYIRDSIYIRPQFDMHYVTNFFQFGSGFVPEGSIVVGISLGRH